MRRCPGNRSSSWKCCRLRRGREPTPELIWPRRFRRATAFAREAVRTLRGLPGVAGVATASRLPLSPDVNMDGVKVPGHHAADEDETPTDTVAVGVDTHADYVAARELGFDLLQGVLFAKPMELKTFERKLASPPG